MKEDRDSSNHIINKQLLTLISLPRTYKCLPYKPFCHKTSSLHAFNRAKPIHTSFHNQSSKLHSISHLNSDVSQLSQSQRLIQMRVTKYNQFNHRKHQDFTQSKQSIKIKHLRKCNSDLMKLQFQAIVQSMIAKKAITHKTDYLNQTQQSKSLWERNQYHSRGGEVNFSGNVQKKLQGLRSSLSKQRIIYLTNSAFYPRGVSSKQSKLGISKKKRRPLLGQDSIQVRPWNHTRKIITEPPQRSRGDSVAQFWPDQKF